MRHRMLEHPFIDTYRGLSGPCPCAYGPRMRFNMHPVLEGTTPLLHGYQVVNIRAKTVPNLLCCENHAIPLRMDMHRQPHYLQSLSCHGYNTQARFVLRWSRVLRDQVAGRHLSKSGKRLSERDVLLQGAPPLRKTRTCICRLRGSLEATLGGVHMALSRN
jgi:hypothetical protein